MTDVESLRLLIAEGIVAMQLTREYVDPAAAHSDTECLLPKMPGYSWWDWTQKAEKELSG